MILYHISDKLRLGDELRPGHERLDTLAEPFLQSLNRGEDCFAAMVLAGQYLRAVLARSGLREWSDYGKWAVEGAFEYIRRREFPACRSRLHCNFFYADPADSRRLFWDDWGAASQEERAAVRIFAVELDDGCPDRRDMRLYDAAYEAMLERQDIPAVLDCARRYFAGEAGGDPVWELLSDRPARAVRDLTAELTGQ